MFLQLLGSLLVFVLTRVFWRRWKYDLHKIPSPPGLPLLGQTLDIIGGKVEPVRMKGQWFKQLGYPKVMKMSLFGHNFLYVRDMECATSVVMAKENPIPTATLFIKGFVEMMGDHPEAKAILTTRTLTPYVKAVRRVYAAAFSSDGLKLALPKVNAVMDRMMDIVKEKKGKGPIELQELCVKMTLDVIGSVALDTDMGGLDGSRDIRKLLTDAAVAGKKRGMNPLHRPYCHLFPNSRTAQEHNAIIGILDAEWERIAKEVAERTEIPSEGKPLWYGLKTLIDPETEKPLAYKDLRAEIASMVIAGADPTGYQLAWLLALLASHPHITEKLLEEFQGKGLYGTVSKEVSMEVLAEMEYLNAVIKEGMRIATIVSGTFLREAPHDMTILGYRIPKGTIIVLPGNRWLDSEAEWGDPQVFRPERWLTGEDMSQKYYLGFSIGPRDCAGQRLAVMEMQVAIIRLLKEYSLELTVPFDDLMKKSGKALAIAAADGIDVSMTVRKHSTV